MASHKGLVYVLETKNGYINKDGEEVYNIEDAMKINFERFGFVMSASRVYEKLGFSNKNFKSDEIKFHTVIDSYDTRLGIIVNFYIEKGYDYQTALARANLDFSIKNLSNYENFNKYIEEEEKTLARKYMNLEHGVKDETIDGETVKLHLYKGNDSGYKIDESNIEPFYSNIGKVSKYSILLKNPHVERYFNLAEEEVKKYNDWQNVDLVSYLKTSINESKYKHYLNNLLYATIKSDELLIYFKGLVNNGLIKFLNDKIRDHYDERQMHITRMFGSYILIQRIDGKLTAVKATPIPIKYCPLMVKLLKEVGGKYAEALLKSLNVEDPKLQTEMMCKLINKVVITGGYFDTNRPLNSCEANVLFGASETMSSAFKAGIIDAAVIVSNNLGTIITTNDSNTQGAVKRMTGLFYTSPSEKIMDTAKKSKIIPVFPHTANIDQLEGVKKAIDLGYKNIAVSVAANDNYLHNQLKGLEKDGVKIYKFGLCSTGIEETTAKIIRDNADVVWSCASKQVKKYIEPNAIAQVGIKIPVHIMTEDGWNIVSNHLKYMDFDLEIDNIDLTSGEEEPVFLNSKGIIKKMKKKDVRHCSDCPHPCI